MSIVDLKKTILDFVGSYQSSNLITITENGTPRGRMMTHLPVGDDLVFWYGTRDQSRKVVEIEKNPAVSVFIFRPSDQSCISAQGKAEIIRDDEIRKKYWQDKWSAYWKKGPTDPNYCLIKVIPQKIEYLDYPNHKQETLEL